MDRANRLQEQPKSRPQKHLERVGDEGLELSAKTPGKTAHSKTGAAECAAVYAQNDAVAPDLQSIIDAWPNLTDEQKAAILVIINKSVTSQCDAVHE